MIRKSSSIGLPLAVCLILGACKTANDPAPAQVDGEDLGGKPVPAAAPKDELARVPPSLWSPAQRRATASVYHMVAEQIAMRERDAGKALKYYEAAYGLDPNPYLGGKMLDAKAAAGQRAEALLEARKMVLLYPRDAQLRYFYGDMLVGAQDLVEAASQLEKCITLDPKHEACYIELAEVYRQRNEPAKALTVAKELTRSVPASITGWSVLSRLHLIMNNNKAALVPARRAWEMQSSNPQLAQIYAITLQLNGKTEQAVRIYEQLYRTNPADEELTHQMVDLYRQLGNLDTAVELLDDMASKSKQTRPAIQMQKVLILWELKRDKEAGEVLERLVTEFPDSDRVLFLAAFGAERIEQPERAIDLYGRVRADSPLRADADVRILGVWQRLKRLDAAIAYGEGILGKDYTTWEAWGMLGAIYADAERYEDAVRTFTNAWAKYPDKPRLLFMKGVYQEKAGDRDGCIATMREVIVKDPENSSAHNYLGFLFAERGERLDEAEKLIKRALEIKPDDGFYLDSLGWVYFQRGDLEQALPLLLRAAAKEPEEGVILEHIGDVHLKKGDKKSARDFYERALKAKTIEPKEKTRIEGKLKELADA